MSDVKNDPGNNGSDAKRISEEIYRNVLNGHEHITYEEFIRFERDFISADEEAGSVEYPEDQEDLFLDFDQRLELCGECRARLKRFIALKKVFPGGVFRDVRDIEEDDTAKEISLADLIQRSLTSFGEGLKQKLKSWLDGARTLLEEVPENAFSVPAFAVRGADQEERNVIRVDHSDEGNKIVDVSKKGEYLFRVQHSGDPAPFCVVLINEKDSGDYRVGELQSYRKDSYTARVGLDEGRYMLFVLTK